MEPENNQQSATNPTPALTTPEAVGGTSTPPSTTPPEAAGDSATVVKSPDQPGGKDKKKMVVVALLVAIILVIVAVVGYYAYTVMGASSTDEMPEATITQEPTPTLEPTIPPEVIEDEEGLNEVIDEIDSATDEAAMEEEVKGLQSDSNF